MIVNREFASFGEHHGEMAFDNWHRLRCARFGMAAVNEIWLWAIARRYQYQKTRIAILLSCHQQYYFVDCAERIVRDLSALKLFGGLPGEMVGEPLFMRLSSLRHQ